jgi:hypothetical protein
MSNSSEPSAPTPETLGGAGATGSTCPRFQLRVEDVYDAVWCRTRSVVVFFGIGTVLSMVVVAVARLGYDVPLDSMTLVLSASPLLVLVRVVWKNRRIGGKRFASLAPEARDVTLDLTDAQFGARDATGLVIATPWASVRGIYQGQSALHILLPNGGTIPVPRRAFASDGAFAAACTLIWSRARPSLFPRYGYIIWPVLLLTVFVTLSFLVWPLLGPSSSPAQRDKTLGPPARDPAAGTSTTDSHAR